MPKLVWLMTKPRNYTSWLAFAKTMCYLHQFGNLKL